MPTRSTNFLVMSAALLLIILAATSCAPRQTQPAPGTIATTEEQPAYLFSYFKRNGMDGVHLAYSRDGITWRPQRTARHATRLGVPRAALGAGQAARARLGADRDAVTP